MNPKQTLKNFVEITLLPSYDKETHTFSEEIQEQYMNSGNAWLDLYTISRHADVIVSKTTFRDVIIELFDRTSFERVEVTSPVTEEEFFQYYVPCKLSYAVDWISEIYNETGKVPVRNDMLSWLASDKRFYPSDFGTVKKRYL